MLIAVPQIESAKTVLPQINVAGYAISGKDTVFYYHTGPKNLVEVPVRWSSRGPSLSLTAAKKTKELDRLLLGWHYGHGHFLKEDQFDVSYGSDKEKKAMKAKEQAQDQIRELPEWDACVRRLRAQVRDVIKGDFKEVRQVRRKEAAKAAIKEAAKSCVTRYYVTFEDVVKMAEEAVVELQIEDVMEG
jgi:phosphotransferase system IIB component